MIEVININKAFNGKDVLKNINATFEAGKTNLIIGQSGSGKTVLMKSMLGLIPIDSGKVLFNNRDFYQLNNEEQKDVRKDIGMVFQGGALFDSMTVEENIMFPLRMFARQSRKEMLKRVNFCLERVNLNNVGRLLPAELSGGMKKRVAIARAIAANPKYLFCDEPNSGLDPETSTVIDTLIQEITKDFNITTVVNTHDMNSVMQIGEKIVFIFQGQLWWEGNKETILHSTVKELNDFLFAGELTKLLKRPENENILFHHSNNL